MCSPHSWPMELGHHSWPQKASIVALMLRIRDYNGFKGSLVVTNFHWSLVRTTQMLHFWFSNTVLLVCFQIGETETRKSYKCMYFRGGRSINVIHIVVVWRAIGLNSGYVVVQFFLVLISCTGFNHFSTICEAWIWLYILYRLYPVVYITVSIVLV